MSTPEPHSPPPPPTAAGPDADKPDENQPDGNGRYERGEAVYDEVYGSARPPRGASVYVDVMVEQLFAEVWSRPGLSIRDRRLLVMGALAGQGCLDKVEMQLRRAVETGELTIDQVDEVVLHLSHYIGWGMASPLAMVGASLRAEVDGAGQTAHHAQGGSDAGTSATDGQAR